MLLGPWWPAMRYDEPKARHAEPAAGLNDADTHSADQSISWGRCVIGRHRPVIKDLAMSDSTFFISEAALRSFKATDALQIYGISSSHFSEAFAASIGFRTHAALRSALSGQVTLEVAKPSNALLVKRLQELGHDTLPDDLQLVPELQHSYYPFRSTPLKARKSERWKAWSNLVVSAVNAGLDQGVFGLRPGENWKPVEKTDGLRPDRAIYRFEVVPGLAAVAAVGWQDHGVISVDVLLNPRKPTSHPMNFSSLRDGDAFAYCWVERKLGAWIQEGGDSFPCKRTTRGLLAGLDIEPKGYAAVGSFML